MYLIVLSHLSGIFSLFQLNKPKTLCFKIYQFFPPTIS